MADTKISALTAATTPLAGTEVLPIVQGGVTKQVSVANLTAGRAVNASTFTSTVATGTAPFTVTSTTQVANLNAATAGTASNLLSNATTGVMQIVGPAAASTRVMTIPDANFTAARTDAAQTFAGTQTINGVLNVTYGTGDQLLINAKTNDSTAANNAGIGLRVNSSATAASRFAQLWFDADGGNLSGGDYFLMTKNGNDGTIDLIQYSNSAMRFAANYVGRAQIDFTIGTTGDVTFNTGNLIQGTAAKGINFTANTGAAGMTSQLLNWYEEGTWTPSVGGTATYSGQTGKYTRIGRAVFVQMDLTINAIGTGSTTTVSGLPFTAGGYSALSTGFFFSLASNVVFISPVVQSGGTTIVFYTLTAAGASTSSSTAVFGNSARVQASGVYFI